jgi:hypothetical protein
MVTTLDTILHTQQIPAVWDPYIVDLIPTIIICGPLDTSHLLANLPVNRTAAPKAAAAATANEGPIASLHAASRLDKPTVFSKDAALADFAGAMSPTNRPSLRHLGLLDMILAELVA